VVFRLSLLSYLWRDVEEYNFRALKYTYLVLFVAQYFIGGKMLTLHYSELAKIGNMRLLVKINGILVYLATLFLEDFCSLNNSYSYFSKIQSILRLGFIIAYSAFVYARWRGRIFRFREETDLEWNEDFKGKENVVPIPRNEVFEYVNNGRVILLYNQYVLDVTHGVSSHPGSSILLLCSIGNLITLQFQGYKKICGILSPHSNYSVTSMRKFIIGRVLEEYNIQIPLRELESPHYYQKLSIVDSERIGPGVHRLVLQSDSYYFFANMDTRNLGGYVSYVGASINIS